MRRVLHRARPAFIPSACSALKTKGNTPKYGLIFHSSFIGRAKQRNKGRIRCADVRLVLRRCDSGCWHSCWDVGLLQSCSWCLPVTNTWPVSEALTPLHLAPPQLCPPCSRYLANKCSIASRIDCFLETNTDAFGQKLKDQVGLVGGSHVCTEGTLECGWPTAAPFARGSGTRWAWLRSGAQASLCCVGDGAATRPARTGQPWAGAGMLGLPQHHPNDAPAPTRCNADRSPALPAVVVLRRWRSGCGSMRRAWPPARTWM